MTKPVTRKMAVDALLHRFLTNGRMATGPVGYVIDCGECGTALQPGDDVQFDHTHSDYLGGPHIYQNLRPLHADCHRKKTTRDNHARDKIKRITGVTKGRPKRKWPKRKMRNG